MNALLLALAVLEGASVPPELSAYHIRVVVSRIDATAPRAGQRAKVLSEPSVVTQNGRAAFFRVGNMRAVADGINGPGVVALAGGFELQMLPSKQRDGRVRLATEVGPKSSDRVRRSEVVLAEGEKVRLRVETGVPSEAVWLEIVVVGLAPEASR